MARNLIPNQTRFYEHHSIANSTKDNHRGFDLPHSGNTGASDFDWTTVYDGLGRRVQSTYQPMSSGVNNGAAASLTYYYDPQVEFLEVGQLNGTRLWKVHGPDRNGVYGGLQGCGGPRRLRR